MVHAELRRAILVAGALITSIGGVGGIGGGYLMVVRESRAAALTEVKPVKAETTGLRGEVQALRGELVEVRREQRSLYDFMRTGRPQPLLERPLVLPDGGTP